MKLERKYKILVIPPDYIFNLLDRYKQNMLDFAFIPNLPEDSCVRDICYNNDRGWFEAKIWSDSFRNVLPGEECETIGLYNISIEMPEYVRKKIDKEIVEIEEYDNTVDKILPTGNIRQ